MKNILVAIDFSKSTEQVIQQASILAQKMGGKLWFIHATPDERLKAIAYESTQFYDFSPEFISAPVGDVELARDLCAEEYKQEHHAMLNLSNKIKKSGIDAQSMLLKGDAADLILEKAEEVKADMIVMGSHGHGMLRKVLTGSVTEAVLRKASCGVLIIPPPEA